MNPRNYYNVQAFADRAGVTVRTLHHYDAIGLLRPTERGPGGRRRYHDTDLLRLQQIRTLKYLGFTLEEIATLLNAPTYDLQNALRTQHAAVLARISELQHVAFALSHTLAALETNRTPEWNSVIDVIRGLSDGDRRAWLSRFYPPETLDWLEQRAAHTPPELLTAGEQAWRAIYADFAAHRHLAPEDPAVQAIAARMQALIQQFTGGDPQVTDGLRKSRNDPNRLRSPFEPNDPALQAWIAQAVEAYEH
jgi:DNA-binding transcriptional MerR regulator